MSVRTEIQGPILIVTIDRSTKRNAVDRATASKLAAAFGRLADDDDLKVGILTGTGGNFCSGADLEALASGKPNRVAPDGDGPMGPTRMELDKPVIAAIEGYAVAGGLELALWCDLRVAGRGAVLGVFCRRWGVPLIDGGTVRLPRLIGESRALDLVLTGRAVGAEEALQMGLVNRVVADGEALTVALDLAHRIAAFPQACLRADRRSLRNQHGQALPDALRAETLGAIPVLAEAVAGALRFAQGAGRHGE